MSDKKLTAAKVFDVYEIGPQHRVEYVYKVKDSRLYIHGRCINSSKPISSMQSVKIFVTNTATNDTREITTWVHSGSRNYVDLSEVFSLADAPEVGSSMTITVLTSDMSVDHASSILFAFK